MSEAPGLSAPAIGARLEEASDAGVARKQLAQIRPLRGIRGVPMSTVARIATDVWTAHHPELPRDARALAELFGGAWEDGLVAIGLIAAALPDAPADALDLALELADRVDDVTTADALGWLVLGPAVLATGGGLVSELSALRGSGRPEVRRAAVSAAMAATSAPVEGPSAAPLRARLGVPQVQFVAAPLDDALAEVATATLRDESPAVRKALRRVLRAWAADAPARVVAWGSTIRGGLPGLIRDEVEAARKRVARQERGR